MKLTKAVSVLLFSLSFVACNKNDSDDDTTTTATTTTTTSDEATVTVLGSSDSLTALRLANSGIDPDSVMIKVYKVAVSEDKYCSDLQVIFENDDPDYQDFTDSPKLGSGTITKGTYECIAIEMSDYVKFTPAESSDDTVCQAGEEYTMDVFRPQGENSSTTSILIDGSQVTGALREQVMTIYLSTASTKLPREPGDSGEEEGLPYLPPDADTRENGFLLDGALEVTGDTISKFVADFNSKVASESTGEGGSSQCGCESPNWGFQ